MGSVAWSIDNPEDWRRVLAIVAEDVVRVYPFGRSHPPEVIIPESTQGEPEIWMNMKLRSLPKDVAETVRIEHPTKQNSWDPRPQRWVA